MSGNGQPYDANWPHLGPPISPQVTGPWPHFGMPLLPPPPPLPPPPHGPGQFMGWHGNPPLPHFLPLPGGGPPFPYGPPPVAEPSRILVVPRQQGGAATAAAQAAPVYSLQAQPAAGTAGGSSNLPPDPFGVGGQPPGEPKAAAAFTSEL